MPQTLLATAGILLLTTHALTVQQWSLYSQRSNITRELEEMGGAVALETMEMIRTRAFDQAVNDGTVTQSLADLGLMEFASPYEHFRTGLGCSIFDMGSEDCNDIDDFNKMKTAWVPFVLAEDTVLFSVDVEVYYVDDGLNRATARTFNKKVVVSISDVWANGQDSYLSEPIQLARVLTYDF